MEVLNSSLRRKGNVGGVNHKVSNNKASLEQVSYDDYVQQQKIDPVGIDSLSKLRKSPADVVIDFLYSHRSSFLKIFSRKIIEDRQLNVLIQVIGGKLCTPTTNGSALKAQRSLLTAITTRKFVGACVEYIGNLRKAEGIKVNLPHCSLKKSLKYLVRYFEFLQKNIPGQIPSNFSEFIQPIFPSLNNDLSSTSSQVKMRETVAVTRNEGSKKNDLEAANAFDPFELDSLAKLLLKPANETIKCLHTRRSCLPKMIFESIPDPHLNVWIQIIGSKLCCDTNFSVLQLDLLKIFTIPKFLCKLSNHVSRLMLFESSNAEFRNPATPPCCSTKKVLAFHCTYYNYLLLPRVQKAFTVPFKRVLENVQVVHRILQKITNGNKVSKFSNSAIHDFKALLSTFEKLENSLNTNKNKKKEITQVVSPVLQPVPEVVKNGKVQERTSRVITAEPFGMKTLDMLQKMTSDQVIAFIHDQLASFKKFIGGDRITENHLKILIRIIGAKICTRSTSLSKLESQKELLMLLTEDTFRNKLLQYTRKLLQKHSITGQGTSNVSPLQILRHLFTFYNFSIILLEGSRLKNLRSNIESVRALLENFKHGRKGKQLSDTTLLPLARRAQAFSNLIQLIDSKLKAAVHPSAAFQPQPLSDPKADKEIHHMINRFNKLNLSGCTTNSTIKPKGFTTVADTGTELLIQDCFSSWDLDLRDESDYSSDYNFIRIRDVPFKNEVIAENGPSLNPMPMKGKHSSALTYLRDQYRLLREDFVAPLRQFLTSMLKKENKFYLGKKKQPGKIVRFYHGVRFHSNDTEPNSNRKNSNYCCLRFSFPKLTEEEWEQNDWLLNESLVILSSDSFQTIYIATVTYKDAIQLAKGFLKVTWEGPQPPILEGVTFLMAESEAYFVSYRYTLKALQIMAQPVPPDNNQPLFSTYPMAKYIVDMSTNQVPPPKYLRTTAERLNFAALTHDMMESGIREAYPCDFNAWPSASEIGMDAAQFSAFQSAVTQELSVIQGPPGTGKTYIGLQLMKLFLSNPQIVQSPILIVCRTNHALDQFLEGALPVMEKLKIPLKPNLLRVGGGSESELLQDYIVRQHRIKKDLKKCDHTFSAPAPSRQSASVELVTLRKELCDAQKMYAEISQAKSFLDSVSLERYRHCCSLESADHDQNQAEFVEQAKAHLLNEINVLNVGIRILEDQTKFRTGEKSKGNEGKVIGMTTTGAAKHIMWVRFMKPKIVIVEEAAEVLESHIVTSITEHCEHLILIGDHKQLRPLTTVHKLATDFHLDISLFERLIHNNLRWSCLETQHRMRPEFSKLLVPTIYEKLRDHPDVMNYPDVAGFKKNLFFIDHRQLEQDEVDSVSKSNSFEAQYLVALSRHMILQDYEPERITILIMYNGQKLLVEKLLKEQEEPYCSVKVETVDSYQGEENDIIILSLVRSNPKNNIGFLKTENRICVALSRARHGFYILGNMNCFTNSKSKMWKKISAELLRQRSIGKQLELVCQIHKTNFHIKTAEDFQKKAPEGGCSRKCNAILPNCDHPCPKFCHVIDRAHLVYKCRVMVNATLICGHECAVECYKATNGELESVPCDSTYLAELDCGHLYNMTCYQGKNPDHITDYQCKEQCVRKCAMGHPCSRYHLCCLDCQPCKVRVTKTLPCGHAVQNVACFIDVAVLKSMHTCDPKIPTATDSI